MKIAMIGQKGIPTLFGGIERHVEGISLNLAQKKDPAGLLYQVFVYARPYYTPKKIKQYKKVNVVHLPSLKTKHLDAISHVFLASWHAIFKIKPDIIHYHGIGPGLCVWIPKLFSPKTKVIFTFHCRDYFHKKWGGFARLSLKIGEMISCYLADEVIPVSLEIQKYIEEKYNRQTNFIPHGVNQEKFTPAEIIKKWGLEKDDYIIAVSRLIKHKGIHYLIKAFQNIKTKKKLVIVGPCFYTEKYEQKLKQIAKNDSRILFLGTQQGKALKELFSNAYFFVNPSEQEGLPFTVLEAASFNQALLISNIPIHQKMFGDLPFFFENKNIKDLKEKIEFLLKNPQLVCERARKLRDYARQNYNWDEVVERTILIYI
ncbi:MAG: glycosyltransferase family 4 protein [Parcubacteria group bacterium]|nr:glycosyltransferase family 4 protein [Parcubacteria group bacterium]